MDHARRDGAPRVGIAPVIPAGTHDEASEQERAFDPKLEGKPVAVLSNNDRGVISRSPECKALVIEMGTPYFKLWVGVNL